MAGKPKTLGPSGRRFAENLRLWRKRRGQTTAEIDQQLRRLGQPILESGISRIESRIRRVDVDDLVALALVLDVAPGTLLLPAVTPPILDMDAPVELTPGRTVKAGDAWAWMTGERSLGGSGIVDFVLANRPHRFMAAFFGGEPLPVGTEAAGDWLNPSSMGVWFNMAGLVDAAISKGMSPDAVRTSFEQALAAALRKHVATGD